MNFKIFCPPTSPMLLSCLYLHFRMAVTIAKVFFTGAQMVAALAL